LYGVVIGFICKDCPATFDFGKRSGRRASLARWLAVRTLALCRSYTPQVNGGVPATLLNNDH